MATQEQTPQQAAMNESMLNANNELQQFMDSLKERTQVVDTEHQTFSQKTNEAISLQENSMAEISGRVSAMENQHHAFSTQIEELSSSIQSQAEKFNSSIEEMVAVAQDSISQTNENLASAVKALIDEGMAKLDSETNAFQSDLRVMSDESASHVQNFQQSLVQANADGVDQLNNLLAKHQQDLSASLTQVLAELEQIKQEVDSQSQNQLMISIQTLQDINNRVSADAMMLLQQFSAQMNNTAEQFQVTTAQAHQNYCARAETMLDMIQDAVNRANDAANQASHGAGGFSSSIISGIL